MVAFDGSVRLTKNVSFGLDGVAADWDAESYVG
jgi:hypothetical protein